MKLLQRFRDQDHPRSKYALESNASDPTRRFSWIAVTASLTVLFFTVTAQGGASAPATLIGPTASDRPLTVALFLPSRDPKGAQDFVSHVTKPDDPMYRRFLSTEAYAARFGANDADYDAVVAWAEAQGLTVGERYTGRTVIRLTGPVQAVQTALGIKFNNFRTAGGRTFYAADGPARLPDAIAGKVGGIIGLSSAAHYKPQFVVLPPGTHPAVSGTGPGGAYSAADLRSLYTVPSFLFGQQSQTLAVFEQGGFAAKDIATYANRNKLPNVPATLRSVDGYGGGIDDAGIELEAVLDIDMLIAMNPAAKQILVYEDGTDSFQVALLDSLSAMATDNTASTISISYGEDEALQGADAIAAENTVLTQMAAQGQAVFASSGDDGAFGDRTNLLNVSDPSSQPLVTGVGGLTVFSGPNSLLGQDVWNNLEAGAGAGGGGISTVWPLPEYQILNGKSVATGAGGSAKFRNVPDVSSIANPLTGVAVYSAENGGWLTIGGTSVSAPVWAGFYSLAGAASESFGLGRLGFANPALYQLPQNGPFGPALLDVTEGTNGLFRKDKLLGFTATFGYDDASGYGSFYGQFTLPDLLLTAAASGSNPPPSPTGVVATVTATSAVISWTDVASAKGYFVAIQNQNTGQEATELTKKTSVKFTGLAPNTFYGYVVGSVSSGGFVFPAGLGFVTPQSK